MKLLKAFAFVAAAAAATTLLADDEAEETEKTEESQPAGENAAAAGDSAEEVAKPKVSDKHFYVLPLAASATGRVEVRQPGKTEWSEIVEGRHYALGCTYRTVGKGSKLVLEFGRNAQATVEDGASFGTRVQPLDVKSRTLVLDAGKVTVKLPGNLPTGLFFVAAPGFTAKDLAGESTFAFVGKGDGDEVTVACVSGSFALEGRHFKVAAMRPSDAMRIRTSGDLLFTGLYCTGGKFDVNLEQGLWQSRDFETGKTRIDDKSLNFQMSPKRAVRIHRAKPSVGENLSVTILTFLENGRLKNRCAFAEKTHALTTGELGPLSKKEKAELEKKAQKAQEEAEKAGGDKEGESGESSGESSEGGESESKE